MSSTRQTLIEQIADEAQTLPEDLAREVLDFIGYLRTKHEKTEAVLQQEAFLTTFGVWEDDRSPEQIVKDIYTTRTISQEERGL